MAKDKWGENVFDPYDYDEPDNEKCCEDCGEYGYCRCWLDDRPDED